MRPITTFLFCCSLLLPNLVSAEQHALLIGVSDYQNKRITDLEGPQFDVAAMAGVLVQHWGLHPSNIVSLVNAQATERNIKDELKALDKRSKPGDDILIYFSGHGTSVNDPDFGAKLNLPDSSGAIVTHEFEPAKHIARIRSGEPLGAADDGLLIGRYEIKPILQQLNRQRTVLVVFDSCFSGNAVRGQASPYTPKHKRLLNIELGSETVADVRTGVTGASRCINCESATEASLFDYDNVIYFGAAADNQLAVDFSQAEIDAGLVETIDDKPHGGFSDALLRVLSNKNANHDDQLSYRRMFNLLLASFGEHCANCGHNPVLLPTQSANAQALSKPFLSSVLSNPTPLNLASHTSLNIAANNLGEDNTNAVIQLASVVLDADRPDISFKRRGAFIDARAADGQLISALPSDWKPAQMTQWVSDRLWLKQRKRLDARNGAGGINASFRDPLTNPVAFAGETVYFTISLESDAKLVVLIANSRGGLSLLYPHSIEESQTVFAASTAFQFPAVNAFQLKVSPPWGTDNVAIYALPADSNLSTALVPLSEIAEFDHSNDTLNSFTQALDSGEYDYSASHVRFHATE